MAPALYEDLLSQLKPDVVIASFAFNDGLTPIRSPSSSHDVGTRSFLWPPGLGRVLALGILDPDVLRAIRSSDQALKVARLETNLRRLAGLVSRDGGRLIVIPEPTEDMWVDPEGDHEPFHDAVGRVASERDVRLAPVLDSIRMADPYAELFVDGVHMNAAGYRLVAEAVQPLVVAAAAEVPRREPRDRP